MTWAFGCTEYYGYSLTRLCEIASIRLSLHKNDSVIWVAWCNGVILPHKPDRGNFLDEEKPKVSLIRLNCKYSGIIMSKVTRIIIMIILLGVHPTYGYNNYNLITEWYDYVSYRPIVIVQSYIFIITTIFIAIIIYKRAWSRQGEGCSIFLQRGVNNSGLNLRWPQLFTTKMMSEKLWKAQTSNSNTWNPDLQLELLLTAPVLISFGSLLLSGFAANLKESPLRALSSVAYMQTIC